MDFNLVFCTFFFEWSQTSFKLFLQLIQKPSFLFFCKNQFETICHPRNKPPTRHIVKCAFILFPLKLHSDLLIDVQSPFERERERERETLFFITSFFVGLLFLGSACVCLAGWLVDCVGGWLVGDPILLVIWFVFAFPLFSSNPDFNYPNVLPFNYTYGQQLHTSDRLFGFYGKNTHSFCRFDPEWLAQGILCSKIASDAF